jgi:hypothetical protein
MTPKLYMAESVFVAFDKAGLLFTSGDSGFAAACLREVFNLAGIADDKVDYWLQKAERGLLGPKASPRRRVGARRDVRP